MRLGTAAVRHLQLQYAPNPGTRLTVADAEVRAHDVLLNAAGAADSQRTAYAARLVGSLRGGTLHLPGYVGQLAHAHLATRPGQVVLDSLYLAAGGAGLASTRLWLPRLALTGLQTARLLRQHQFRADSLTLDAPHLTGPLPTRPLRPLHQLLAPYLQRADLRSLRIRDGAGRATGAGMRPTVQRLNLLATGLRVDATAARDPRRVAYARAWQVSAGPITARYDAPFYLLACQQVRLNTRAQSLRLTGLAVRPTVSARELDRRKGEQSVHLAVRVPLLRAEGLNFGRLARQNNLTITSLTAERPRVEIASDGRAPLPRQPSLFTPQAVRRLPLLVSVRTVRVRGGTIRTPYRSPRSPLVGHIVIARLRGTLHNLSNDPRRMTAAHPLTGTAQAYLQNRCRMQLHLRIPLLDPLGRHTVTGTFGAAPFALLNPMIAPTWLFVFSSGQLHQLRFRLRANRQQADGTMWATYSGLHLRVLKSKGHTLKTNLLTRLETGAANTLFIRDNNPRANGCLAPGRLRSRRDLRFAVFVLWRQALVSGLLNSAGVPQKLAQKLSEGKN